MRIYQTTVAALISMMLFLPALTVYSQEYKPYLFVGQTRTYLVNVEGELYSWSNKGEEVKGTLDFIYNPEKMRENVRYASNNDNHTVIVTRENELWAYGSNRYGQLGDGTRSDRPNPVKIMDDVEYAETGRNFTVILKTNGEVWVCGLNQLYGLWGGDDISHPDAAVLTPVKVMDNVRVISSGGTHVMAIKDNGELWGWGDNRSAAVGNGSDEDVYEPELIMENVKAVSACYSKTAVVDIDGTIWEWGMIGKDPGDITRDSIYTRPKNVNGLYESVCAGQGYTLGLRQDGGLYIWGRAEFAGSDNYIYNPELISSNVAYASAGRHQAAAVDRNGNVKFWSRNAHGITDLVGSYIPLPITIMSGLDLSAPADNRAAGMKVTAKPSTSQTYVNNRLIPFESYNINGSNYFKLRDIAYVLNDTGRHFDVIWHSESSSVIISLGGRYSPVGGELAKGDGAAKNAVYSSAGLIAAPQSAVSLSDIPKLYSGYKVSADAYIINGNSFFKLRDLGEIIGFKVDWDPEANAVSISA